MYNYYPINKVYQYQHPPETFTLRKHKKAISSPQANSLKKHYFMLVVASPNFA